MSFEYLLNIWDTSWHKILQLEEHSPRSGWDGPSPGKLGQAKEKRQAVPELWQEKTHLINLNKIYNY